MDTNSFITISYEKDIVEWLEKCYSISEKKPLVQSVIKQYCELVKQITNTDMDTKYRNDLMSVMLASENVIAVGEMLQLREKWFREILDTYIWKPLEEFAKQKKMLFGKKCEKGDEKGAWIIKKNGSIMGSLYGLSGKMIGIECLWALVILICRIGRTKSSKKIASN